MKNFKIFLCITVMVSMQTVAFGQTFGYMVSDNDQDATNFPQAFQGQPCKWRDKISW